MKGILTLWVSCRVEGDTNSVSEFVRWRDDIHPVNCWMEGDTNSVFELSGGG